MTIKGNSLLLYYIAMAEGDEQRELTFGEKAVGLTFNPGNLPEVQMIKEAYAKIIDMLNNERNVMANMDWDVTRMLSIAITETQTAQMRAVKAVTRTK